MELPLRFPKTIAEYARTLAIAFDAAVVRCKFCFNALNYLDLSNFDAKHLQLIWRDLRVFGVCGSCLKDSAKFEITHYYSHSELPVELHRQGKLVKLKVRCVLCYRILSYAEKLQLIAEQRLVHYVRNSWRALCKFCKQK
ncbi:E6 protein [Bos taurus papillomavirus 20]|uniref:Protein E6 n=1 Tax=Bos taurus papillomavirus 20 TaxID=1887218 RepID=A0A1B2K212_9PAPI|nr:E6 protein [Bos taurus papillomavirus 20]ANZ90257.1 E6 protein [Bos taurus papillomavirus 20]